MEFLIRILMTVVATGIVCQKEMRDIYKEIKTFNEEE